MRPPSSATEKINDARYVLSPMRLSSDALARVRQQLAAGERVP
jgi:hypothetical protein